MKGRRAPILALLLALLLVLPGCEPLNQALAAPALDEDFSLSDIPAFSGQPYVVVGDNTPQFPEEDLYNKGKQPDVTVGIVSAQKIHFSLNKPYLEIGRASCRERV